MNFTKYEKTRIIGARALQLAMGAPLILKFKKDTLKKINYSTIEIAKKEYLKGIIPITIKRPMPEKK